MHKGLMKFSALILVMAFFFGLVQIDAYAGTAVITDLSLCADFSRDAVKRLVSEGIITGGPNGSFNPKGYVTRAQVVTLIIKSMGISLIDPDAQTFKDLSSKHWSYQYIETAYHYGITAGTSPTTFSPDKNCTREEMVTMLIRANKINSVILGGSQLQSILNQIKDKDQISPWAKGPMAYAYSNSIISGYNYVISPKGLATREQMAVILDNYMTRYISSVNSTPLSVSDLTTVNIPEIRKSVVTIMSYDESGAPLAQGSGFCIGNSLFLTNFHVLEYGSSFKIMSDDGIIYETAGIVKYDVNKDLAMIKSKQPMSMKPLNLGSKETVVQGDPVVAVGSPLGLQNTVSNGIISAIRREGDISLLQTSAPITHGSSGGPLFDLQGNVIGVTTSGYDSGNLNFAVPVDYAMDWIRSLSGLSFSSIPVLDIKQEFGGYYGAVKYEIIETLKDLLYALSWEDLNTYKSMLDPENPAYGLVNSMFTPIFEMYDLDYRTMGNVKFTSIFADTAEVEFNYVILKRYTSSPEYRERNMLGKYTLRYDGEGWKIVAMDDILVGYTDGGPADGNTGYDDESIIKSDKIPATNLWLNMKVTDSVADPVQPVIYITDKAAKKLYAVNYETNKVSELSFTLPPEQLAFANNKLYVALLKQEHNPSMYDNQKGAVAIIDALQFKLIKQIDINIDPYGIAADNKGHIFVNSGSGGSYMRSYSEETGQEISFTWNAQSSCSLEFNQASNTLYLVGNTLPPSLNKFEVDDAGRILNFKLASMHDVDVEMNDTLRVSPDGNYLMNGTGALFYTSMQFVSKIKGFNDAAFNLENNRFYIGDNSTIYAYDYTGLKPLVSYDAKGQVIKLVYRNGKLISIVNYNGYYQLKTLTLN